MRKEFITAPLFLALAVSSCGTKDSKKSGRKGNEIKSELLGKWVGTCEPKGPLGVIMLAGERHEMNFTLVPGDLIKSTQRFHDKDCAQAFYNEVIYASYAAVGAAEKEPGATNLNVTVHKVEITPAAEAAAKFNEAKYCGATDWQDNVAKTVTNADCAGKKYDAGQVIFDIYNAEGNTLFLGKSSFFRDGNSASTRPAAIDRDHPLTKK